MQTHDVVVRPPCLDDPSGHSQRWEQVLVQALVAKATVERIYERIVGGRSDKLVCENGISTRCLSGWLPRSGGVCEAVRQASRQRPFMSKAASVFPKPRTVLGAV